MPEEISNKEIMIALENLENRILNLERDPISIGIGATSRSNIENVVDDFLTGKMLNATWSDFVYYFTNFESIDGWSTVTDTGAITANATAGGIVLGTGTGSSGNTNPVSATLLNTFAASDTNVYFLGWNREQRARFTVQFSVSDTDCEEYIAVGDIQDAAVGAASGADIEGYGFLVDETGTLYGLLGDGTTTNRTQLMTSVNNTNRLLEARYSPSKQVNFYVDNVLRGTLTATFPTNAVRVREQIFDFQIMSDTNTNREVTVFSAEYIQKK